MKENFRKALALLIALLLALPAVSLVEDHDSNVISTDIKPLDVTAGVTPETGGRTTATVETDKAPVYQVEFTYNKMEYVLPGGASVAMSEILETLGLTGEVTAVEISNESLFSVSNADGAWVVTAHRAFSTAEWMKVTINGAVYDITVTDAQPVSYIQRSWNENDKTVTQSEETAEAASITSSSTTWGTDGKTTWCAVDSDVTISSRVTVKGTVNLILCNGFTLTASNGITVTGSNVLNI